MHPLEGPFSATGASKCGPCSVDSTISMCGSDCGRDRPAARRPTVPISAPVILPPEKGGLAVPQELVPSPYSWAPELQQAVAEYLAQIQLEQPLRFHLGVANRRFV